MTIWSEIAPKDWLGLGLQTLTAIATTTVAIYVATISNRQWFIAKEKLRLDLYEKRFAIYARTLRFCHALQAWRGSPEQVKLQQPFAKAFRESRFLFPSDSGVYQLMQEFHSHAFKITNSHRLAHFKDVDPQETVKRSLERDESAGWMLTSMDSLERRLAPFLNFKDL